VKLLWQVPLHVLPTVLLGAQLKVALSTVGEVGHTTGGMGGSVADTTRRVVGCSQRATVEPEHHAHHAGCILHVGVFDVGSVMWHF
jgi:hypothetical protein